MPVDLYLAERVLQANLPGGPEGFVRDVLEGLSSNAPAFDEHDRIALAVGAALIGEDPADASDSLRNLPLSIVELTSDANGHPIRISPADALRHPLISAWVRGDLIGTLAHLSWNGAVGGFLSPEMPILNDLEMRRTEAATPGGAHFDAGLAMAFPSRQGFTNAVFYFSAEPLTPGPFSTRRTVCAHILTCLGAATRIVAALPAATPLHAHQPCAEGLPPGAVVH